MTLWEIIVCLAAVGQTGLAARCLEDVVSQLSVRQDDELVRRAWVMIDGPLLFGLAVGQPDDQLVRDLDRLETWWEKSREIGHLESW